jgi:hypothetical protein
MQILTWAHKRHRLLAALASLDTQVAARASLLEENWADLPTLADAAPGQTDMAAAAGGSASISPALTRAAATVAAAHEASLAPAKPMKGGPIPNQAIQTPPAPDSPVPAYLQ